MRTNTAVKLARKGVVQGHATPGGMVLRVLKLAQWRELVGVAFTIHQSVVAVNHSHVLAVRRAAARGTLRSTRRLVGVHVRACKGETAL